MAIEHWPGKNAAIRSEIYPFQLPPPFKKGGGAEMGRSSEFESKIEKLENNSYATQRAARRLSCVNSKI